MTMSNKEKLGLAINNRMQKVISARNTPIAELGEITESLGLKVGSLGNTIPKGDYMVSRHLAYGAKDKTLTTTKAGQGKHGHGPSGSHGQYSGDGTHSHPATEGAHVHDILIPETMRSLKAGDRVLVVWCDNEPIVTDILVSS